MTAGARIGSGDVLAGLSLSGAIIGGPAEDDLVQICASTIPSIAVRGGVSHARILAGADLGDDWRLGGSGADADSFSIGAIGKLASRAASRIA